MRCYFPALIRDSLFFVSHYITYNLLMYGDHYVASLFRFGEFAPPPIILIYHKVLDYFERWKGKEVYLHVRFFRIIYLLTNPFDVLVTKLANQINVMIYHKFKEAYTNPF